MTPHWTDEELDGYLHNRSIQDGLKQEHLKGCPSCQTRLISFQKIDLHLKAQPISAFKFDVVSLVMPHIQSSPVEKNAMTYMALGVLLFSIAAIIGLAMYFKEYFYGFLPGLKNNVFTLTVLPLIFYMLWNLSDMIRGYHQKINILAGS